MDDETMQTRTQDSTMQVTALGATATAGPWTLIVVDVLSGSQAIETIAQTNAGNPAVPNGMVYLLAKVRAENVGSVSQVINLADFTATGNDGILRPPTSLAVPEPALQGTVEAGASLEGWLPMTVDDPASATLWFESTILAGNWTGAVLGLAQSSAIPQFPASSQPDPSIGDSPQNAAKVGEVVHVGDWAVTIVRTGSGQEIFDQSDYRLRALGESGDDISTWFGILLQATNLAAIPTVFSMNALELADSNGEPWDNVMALTAPSPDASREVLPGATREGWAAFQLKPYSTAEMVRIAPSVVADAPRYVALSQTAAAAVSSKATPGATKEPLTVSIGDSVTVTETQVNLRKDPSSTGEIVAELTMGTTMTITGEAIAADGYQWYPVTVTDTGETGYVVEDFIARAGN